MRRLIWGILFVFAARLAHADLIITAVFDGPLTGGVPKGVELFALEDIPDLSLYGLGSANNGGGSDGEEFSFPNDSANAGEFIYVASETDQFTAFFGFQPNYVNSAATAINGDDAIELFQSGAVIDLFGDIHADGSGEAWEYTDSWAARNSDSTPSTIFNPGDWQFGGPNALDGASTNSQANAPVPLQSFSGNGDGGGSEAPALVLISAVQGTPTTYTSNTFGETDVSPLIGQQVTIEGIVVGDFQDNDGDTARNLNGFFLQEETVDEDGDALSSEGIFVYTNNIPDDVKLGDKVRLSGTVDQYFGETQISGVSGVQILDADQLSQVNIPQISLLTSSDVSLNQNGDYQADLESYEGMLVKFIDHLQISEQFQLDRFNEIKLVAGDRPQQFTQANTPDPLQYDLFLRELGAREITYDDGQNIQNSAIDLLPGFADYHEENAPRMGHTIEGLTGIVDYKWAGNNLSSATWRIRAHEDEVNNFTSQLTVNSDNPRPLEAPRPQGNLLIASLNVLNLFTTLDVPGAITAAGHDPRGANSEVEFLRQIEKIGSAIIEMDADILGLIEIENEFDSINDDSTAIEQLVNRINDRVGEELYDYIYPGTTFTGADAISVAFIYKPTVVEPAHNTQAAQLNDLAAATLAIFKDRNFSSQPIFDGDATNRVPLAVSFTHLASKDAFTVVANHFKSKGTSGLDDPSDINFDKQDGAGFWNARRLDAAIALKHWLATAPTGLVDDDVVILGDLNAYRMEEPVQYLLNNAFQNPMAENAYSYVFHGQVGSLDYILPNDSMAKKVLEASIWHINADEADALDYNLDFGREPAYFNLGSPTRNSDHDPVLVGFQMVDQNGSGEEMPDLDALLMQFREGVNDRSIKGSGHYVWTQKINKLHFFGLLYSAKLYEEAGKMASACYFLSVAETRSDGLSSNLRDLIVGSGVKDLNTLIGAVKGIKAC